MTEKRQAKITPAKGRPLLTWVGKRPLSRVTAFPAQHIETFAPTDDAARRVEHDLWADWPDRYPRGGLLFNGDNKEVLAHLLANGFRGKVKLIYIDPPFDSGADYVRRVRLRGVVGTTQLEGESYTLGEQIQYQDIWANDNYLQFMYERLMLLKELLTEDGSLWLHCDWRKSHHLRMLLDEVFGAEGFQAHVVWRTMTSSGYKGKKSLGRSHADLLYYSKGRTFIYNPQHVDISHEMLARYKHTDPDGRRYKDSYLGDVSSETIDRLREENLLYVTSSGGFRIKHYLDEAQGVLIDDVWTDIDPENSQSLSLTDYPTQKPEALLTRIIELTSNPGDIVLDCFIGSGTTAAAAQKTGRRWIGCDINKGAIQTAAKRLQGIIQEQIAVQSRLVDTDDGPPNPAQFSCTVWRVNDYDLQIQHNEAVNLACEHIGIQRTRTDPFFDGTLGRNLVKIVPFNHPLSPLDLDEIRRELVARPEEDRSITVVCLGKELAADAWIEDWNRLRRGKDSANRIEVIELRTDPRYGKFFEHKPASAKTKISRLNGGLHIDIVDFVSPTIIERLAQQAGVLKPQIDDWRAMVDCVMIDPAYDGEVFNVALSDVPARKDYLVKGSYTLPAPDGPTTVAVKIIDMLGEEVLVTEQV